MPPARRYPDELPTTGEVTRLHHLRDKDMANDMLETMKHGTSDLLKACLESSNQELRQTLMSFVRQGEQTQYRLYQLAERKGWYLPAGQAQADQVQRVEAFFPTPAGAPVG